MARYVDGFVIPIPKRKVKAYLRHARLGAKVWKEHGALGYAECLADDLSLPWGLGFGKMARLKAGETLIFSFVIYRSRADRDRVNAKAFKDPRLAALMKAGPMPFDVKRMAVGGFKELVGW
jgi:uncharacterized protein YbaA (DUF1428 family)